MSQRSSTDVATTPAIWVVVHVLLWSRTNRDPVHWAADTRHGGVAAACGAHDTEWAIAPRHRPVPAREAYQNARRAMGALRANLALRRDRRECQTWQKFNESVPEKKRLYVSDGSIHQNAVHAIE
jgi:hypothetical protein